MKTYSLNGTWLLAPLPEQGEHFVIPAQVPGSVLSAMLEEKKIPDPFYRTNEYEVRELFRQDYLFFRRFELDEAFLEEEQIDLVCHGLDTLAEISINGTEVGSADNMHRTWIFPCKDCLRPGENEIRIVLKAPISYIESHIPQEGKEIHYIPSGCMAGNQYLRKAHCMFGWDWGAQLPDAGIWRDIELTARSRGRLRDVVIYQEHTKRDETGDGTDVTLHISAPIDLYRAGRYKVTAMLSEPQVRPERAGKCGLKAFGEEAALLGFSFKKLETEGRTDDTVSFAIPVENARLWWPNGLGEQPLYTLTVELAQMSETGEELLERKQYRIGLRTFTVSTEKDEWGEEFAFTVNHVKFFSMGADYIPEDTVYSRITEERIEYLIRSAARAHYNTLRVWGGGYYPSDTFYDLCDRYGIMVWQDLMYACNVYELTEDFADNILEETRDNVRRIRHHASLALWCGNNEMESAWAHWYGFCDHSMALRADYLKMFEVLLPAAVRETDGQTFWWPSSPSSGGWIDDPDDDNRGDRHYWDVWHGQKPFSDYLHYYFRFCSEFGFQSFPSAKTVERFTLPEDRNIFSRVMESHQKNGYANGKILYYLSENFLYPKDFSSLLYVTQILQGIAIKCGVEHWRRNRGRCMGALYWQMNDSWPVASWSSIDYYGRWKALHYMARVFFNPLAFSVLRHGTRVEFAYENETFAQTAVSLRCSLKTMSFSVLDSFTVEGVSEAFSGTRLGDKEFAKLIQGRSGQVFLEVTADHADGSRQTEVVVFAPYKHVQLPEAKLQARIRDAGDAFIIHVTADAYAAFVELDLAEADAVFGDNYFHITDEAGVQVLLDKKDIRGMDTITLEEVRRQLVLRSLRDTY